MTHSPLIRPTLIAAILLMDGNNMRNKKILLGLILFPVISFSAIDDLKEERMKILSELGLPLPDSGIKLVPRSSFGLNADEIKQGIHEEEEMKTKGYIEAITSRPKELIYFKEHAKSEMQQYKNVSRETSTHIRASINDLKLGFKFKGIPPSLAVNTIGIVPQGGFHPEGWSGAVQFFEAKDIGTCAYAQMSVAVSHTAIEIALEDADYRINNKLTLIEVRGSKDSGFDYKIRWFDDVSFHELECANMNYSDDTTQKVIGLAEQIDSYQ